MEKVLLAISGTTPDRKAFKYAIDLCKRIKADLKILHVINPQNFGSYITKIKSTAHNAKRFLEDSMVAATFAEADEHETASALMALAKKNTTKLLHESAGSGVSFELSMRSGDTTEEIVNYVRKNKDIVIAVYDQPPVNRLKSGERKRNNDLESIAQGLSIPVVMIQAEA